MYTWKYDRSGKVAKNTAEFLKIASRAPGKGEGSQRPSCSESWKAMPDGGGPDGQAASAEQHIFTEFI